MPGIPDEPREFESRSLGSGFIVSADGYILTNAHVVDAADEILVRLTDKRELKARVIGTDKRTDVALIKIEATSGLPTVRLGDPGVLKVGEWVVAIGSPFGFDNSVTAGIVSAKGRSLPQENYVPFIQTDVAVNPGNSGGPLFNSRARWSASTPRSIAVRVASWAFPLPFRSMWRWTCRRSCAPAARSAAVASGSSSRR
jgi:serine protease Do